MNYEVKKKWIDALRSGKYTQATDQLRIDEGFCCLGVLCDLYMQENKEAEWIPAGNYKFDFFTDRDGEDYESVCLPQDVIGWAGLDSTDPNTMEPVMNDENSLSTLNDNGYSFLKIAEIIERDL